MILVQWGARGAASASSKAWTRQPSSRAALAAATLPGRPRRIIAKSDEVGTGFGPSGIIEVIIRHGPVAMACTAARVARRYVSINVNLRSFLEDRRGVNEWFTPHLNRHISHPAAPYISPRCVGVVGAHRQHRPSTWTGCINPRADFRPKSPISAKYKYLLV